MSSRDYHRQLSLEAFQQAHRFRVCFFYVHATEIRELQPAIPRASSPKSHATASVCFMGVSPSASPDFAVGDGDDLSALLCHKCTGMSKQNQAFFAPCPRGLEAVLRAELEQLGAQDATDVPGGVSFAGTFPLCYAVNLHSRVASRVLWRVFHGTYRDEHDIFQAAHDLPDIPVPVRDALDRGIGLFEVAVLSATA